MSNGRSFHDRARIGALLAPAGQIAWACTSLVQGPLVPSIVCSPVHCPYWGVKMAILMHELSRYYRLSPSDYHSKCTIMRLLLCTMALRAETMQTIHAHYPCRRGARGATGICPGCLSRNRPPESRQTFHQSSINIGKLLLSKKS